MNKNFDRITLQEIARKAMISRGLEPDFPADVFNELQHITHPATCTSAIARDMRHLLWCSVDNDDSLDLDQLSYAEQLPGNKVRLLIAIAATGLARACKPKNQRSATNDSQSSQTSHFGSGR